MTIFLTVRIVPPPPAREWTWQDCLGISDCYRKEALDLALKKLFLMLTISRVHDDRSDLSERIALEILADRLGPESGADDFNAQIHEEIQAHCLQSVLAKKPEGMSRVQLFEEKYFEPFRKHQENVQAWQARRAEVIWQRYFVLAPLVHLVGWIYRQFLGIAAKERALAHSKDPNYLYVGSAGSLQNLTYQHLQHETEAFVNATVPVPKNTKAMFSHKFREVLKSAIEQNVITPGQIRFEHIFAMQVAGNHSTLLANPGSNGWSEAWDSHWDVPGEPASYNKATTLKVINNKDRDIITNRSGVRDRTAENIEQFIIGQSEARIIEVGGKLPPALLEFLKKK